MMRLSGDVQLTISGYDWGPAIQWIDFIPSESRTIDEEHLKHVDVFLIKQRQPTLIPIRETKVTAERIRFIPKLHPGDHALSLLVFDSEKKQHRFCEEWGIAFSVKQPLPTNDGSIDQIVVDKVKPSLFPDLSGIAMDVYRFNHSHTLAYAMYDPKPDHPIPLIVWLHGAGEGGFDPQVVLLGNPAFRLKEPPIQDVFGQAMVLYPQSPTFWMDDGYQLYTTTGQSKYAQSVFGLIERTVRKNQMIDPDRVYIGGNSNGGFMTLRLLLDHPRYFAGAFPICEAYADQWLLESEIRQLQQEAIWFTVASNDRVVEPEQFTLATYRRIKQDPSANCHLSLFETVVDPTGKYVNSRNEPYEYGGHAVWILALAGRSTAQIDKKEVEMFSWLAEQNNRSRR